MDMYLTAIGGYAMLETKPNIARSASPADEDAYYAKVGAPIMDPWVRHVIAWARAGLSAARRRTTAASLRQPVRHA